MTPKMPRHYRLSKNILGGVYFAPVIFGYFDPKSRVRSYPVVALTGV
jgi:hypothetical protein